jgi:hypothetical protein
MKRGTVLIVFCLCIVSARAQQITEKHIAFTGKDAVSLNIQIADSITISTWSKDEVYVKSSVNINDNKDNAGYITSFGEDGRTVKVDAKFSESYFKGKKNCCNESVISWQVFIPEKSRLTVETIDGNITITGNPGTMKIKSISGYVDLALESGRPADLTMSTISGSMYSDIDFPSGKGKGSMPMKIFQKLNNGGEPITLETISGDIFLRKAH